MVHGVLDTALRSQRNGHSESATSYNVITEHWSCRKRDGRLVPFDYHKIEDAIEGCLDDINLPHDQRRAVILETVRGVLNNLAAQFRRDKSHVPDIEDVQRLVIQQLWAEGQFDAAEAYQNYREERRKRREERPIPAEYAAAVAEDQARFPTPIQYYQFMSKFSRWREQDKRRETWREAIYERIIPWFQNLSGVKGKLTDAEWKMLTDAAFNLEASPAMRVVQMAGPALDRCHIGVYNCAGLPIIDLRCFAEHLYILMQGSGCGFSVESEFVSQLPRIKKQTGVKHVHVVPDSTEGWCDTLLFCLERWFDGEDVEPDVSLVRKAGTPLKTKGGTACLTGDTIIYKDRKKSGSENTLTVAQLYEKRVKTPRRLRHIKIRSLDEATGMFVRNRVLDVIDNGMADVFEVITEHGYHIKATANHRFMNEQRAYQHLDLFEIGDLIAVNGVTIGAGHCEECGAITHARSTRCKTCFLADPRCLDCGVSLSRRASRCRACREKSATCIDCGVSVSRRADRCVDCTAKAATKPDALPTTARGRKECQSQNTGICAKCGRDDMDQDGTPRSHVHHIDRNTLNNAPGNLLTLCEPCHHQLHAIEDSFGNPYSHRYVSFDRIVAIRPAGRQRVYDLVMQAPNHNFVANGFVSHNSGPEPLIKLIDFARSIILKRQGHFLTDLDCHDICCMIGKIVQVGGVRRASCISLSDLNSLTMRNAKSGNWYEHSVHRTMANNSAVYETKPDAIEFMEEWLTLGKSGSGERGIFNRYAVNATLPKRRKPYPFFITNPCSEILFRLFGLCNLSIAVARPGDTEEDLIRKVRIAAYFCCMQATCTNFRYVRDEWRKNAEEERLLGVDITGHADCDLLKPTHPGRTALIRRLKKVVQETADELCDRFGIPRSAADTCIKPGGDSGVFFDCASGVSPRYSLYQWRWCRESQHSPVAKFLIAEGVPYAVAPEDPSLYVFGFPRKAPEGSMLRDDLTAIEQLENWLIWKENWAEHSVSATIYVEPHEWLTVGNWVYEHFDRVTGLSFLPKTDHVYKFAPNEELTEEQYDKAIAEFPELNWAKLSRHETYDQTQASVTPACVSGACSF